MLAEPPISEGNVLNMFLEIVKRVLPYTAGQNRVNRLGVIHQYKIDYPGNAAQKIFSDFLKIDLEGSADDVNIRFALKKPTTEALAAPNKKTDYRDVIIGIGSQREVNKETEEIQTSINLSIDYQMYYVPVRHLNNVNINKHFNDAKFYIDNNIKKAFPNLQMVAR